VAIVYVDGTVGNDAHDGSAPVPAGGTVGPKKTIIAGMQATPDNGQCVVAPGVYSGPTLFIRRPIAVVGAGPDRTIIKGAANQQIVRVTHSGATFSNFCVRDGFYGVLVYQCSPRITNNVLTGNLCGISIVGTDSSPSVHNNTVSGNLQIGVRIGNCNAPDVRNNIVTGNGPYGVGLIGGSAILAYNDVWGHTNDYYRCIPGEGSLSAPPIFVAPGNYRLNAASACRDAGDPGATFNDPGDTRNDMGAYGGPDAFLPKALYWYPRLLGHPKIAAAAGLDPDQKAELMTAIRELEFSNTSHWPELEDTARPWLVVDDLRKIWLRRLAMCFYQEVSGSLPWSMLDYEQAHLNAFLSFTIANPQFDLLGIDQCMGFQQVQPYAEQRYAFDSLVWAANPVPAMRVMESLREAFQPQTPEAALHALIQHMRDLGWLHADVSAATYGYSWADLPHHLSGENYLNGQPVRYWNYDTFFQARGSGCWQGSALIRETMRAFNVPVIKGNNAYGHQGVYAPTLDRIMVHGDDIFTLYLRHIPPVHSFKTRSWYEGLLGRGTTPAETQCAFVRQEQKENLIAWFGYYASPEHGAQLATVFAQYYRDDTGTLKSTLTQPLRDASGNACPGPVLRDDPEVAAWVAFLANYYGL
jgi:parallel beta-helix repeat protein